MKQIMQVTLNKKKETPNTIVYSNGETSFYLQKKYLSGDAPEKIILTVAESEQSR